MIGTARWREVAISLALSAGLAGPSLGQSLQPPVVPQYGTAEHLGVASCASSTCHGGGGARQSAATCCSTRPSPGSSRTSTPASASCSGRALAEDRPQSRARGRTRRSASTATPTTCPRSGAARSSSSPTASAARPATAARRTGSAPHRQRRRRRPRRATSPPACSRPPTRGRGRGSCLSCHFGDETKFVTHRLMGAGHPRLSFELDTFTAIEPAHFDVDDDYRARKHVAERGPDLGHRPGAWRWRRPWTPCSTPSAATPASSPSWCSSTATPATSR